jgi:hypothetical protein
MMMTQGKINTVWVFDAQCPLTNLIPHNLDVYR